MTTTSVNNRVPPSEHIIGHANNRKYQTCYPCTNVSSASALKSMEEGDAPNNSLNSTQPQLQEQATNVGDLMSKAKKAAASLWLILHAQVSYHL